MEPDTIEAGEWRFTFTPDGQDPGVGDVTLETQSAVLETHGDAVTRYEWDEFVSALTD